MRKTITLPDPPATPPPCICCGAAGTNAIYVWLARGRRGVIVVGPPVSIHVKPQEGRLLRWVGLCGRHHLLRMLSAIGLYFLSLIVGLALCGAALLYLQSSLALTLVLLS